MKRLIPLALVVALVAVMAAVGMQDDATTVRSSATNTGSTTTSSSSSTSTTTSTTTTTVPIPPAPVTVTTARTIPPQTSRSKPAPAVVDAAFWLRLSKGCECRTGTCDGTGGYFQFSSDTARKIGYRPGQSYETQRAEAITWLGMIGGRGGSRSGWPVCWWSAGGR